jgi:DNA-binding HxlR family transcriptional regulator
MERLYMKDAIANRQLPACPVETTLILLSDKWKVLILRDLQNGTKRFGELKKSIGKISQKVLTANLRSMEDDGLVTRKVYPEVPPKVEYTLTELGKSLEPILIAMKNWGEKYKDNNKPGAIYENALR